MTNYFGFLENRINLLIFIVLIFILCWYSQKIMTNRNKHKRQRIQPKKGILQKRKHLMSRQVGSVIRQENVLSSSTRLTSNDESILSSADLERIVEIVAREEAA